MHSDSLKSRKLGENPGAFIVVGLLLCSADRKFMFRVVELPYMRLHVKCLFNLLRWKFNINFQLDSGQETRGWSGSSRAMLKVRNNLHSVLTALLSSGEFYTWK